MSVIDFIKQNTDLHISNVDDYYLINDRLNYVREQIMGIDFLNAHVTKFSRNEIDIEFNWLDDGDWERVQVSVLFNESLDYYKQCFW